MITYKEQFDKLTEAYIHNKVEPYRNCACFIGNLLGGDEWAIMRETGLCIGQGHRRSGMSYIFTDSIISAENFIEHRGHKMYTPEDIVYMENNFLKKLYINTVAAQTLSPVQLMSIHDHVTAHPNYEEALFIAFCSTLEILKQIHIRNGEKVDGKFTFAKRGLAKV